jgi:large subunit ribosomal protein L21
MYAVIRTGGKQLRVEPGDVIDVERLAGEAGAKVELREVLMIGGDQPRIGRPLVDGARVTATIQGESSGPKIRIFKYKRRKRYRLHKGHRQHYTRLVIDAIEG